MANYDANASKIKVVRAMLAIEYSLYKENLERIPSFCPNIRTNLKNSSWELDGVLNWIVKCIYNCWISMCFPVSFVNLKFEPGFKMCVRFFSIPMLLGYQPSL